MLDKWDSDGRSFFAERKLAHLAFDSLFGYRLRFKDV